MKTYTFQYTNQDDQTLFFVDDIAALRAINETVVYVFDGNGNKIFAECRS